MTVYDLPAVNATLNAMAAACLLAGYLFIRQGRRDAHRAAMLAALGLSTAFLASYLVYHYHVGSRPFTGQGAIRAVYFAVLITHVILATVIVPMVLVTVSRALAARFDAHRRIARWTWPLWMYVSVTGVIVYLMLYQM